VVTDKRLSEGDGDDDRAIFSIWGSSEPPLVLASNRLDGSQHGIPVRRPKKDITKQQVIVPQRKMKRLSTR
jgi:hypothetical protein